jgi:hypothetical protein
MSFEEDAGAKSNKIQHRWHRTSRERERARCAGTNPEPPAGFVPEGNAHDLGFRACPGYLGRLWACEVAVGALNPQER